MRYIGKTGQDWYISEEGYICTTFEWKLYQEKSRIYLDEYRKEDK